MLSCVQLFVTIWTVAHQAPQSMGSSQKEYWNGLPFLPPEDLPDPGIKSISFMSLVFAGEFLTTSATWKALSDISGVGSEAKSNLEKEKWSWRNQVSWLQTILSSYSHQNSVILAQK